MMNAMDALPDKIVVELPGDGDDSFEDLLLELVPERHQFVLFPHNPFLFHRLIFLCAFVPL